MHIKGKPCIELRDKVRCSIKMTVQSEVLNLNNCPRPYERIAKAGLCEVREKVRDSVVNDRTQQKSAYQRQALCQVREKVRNSVRNDCTQH